MVQYSHEPSISGSTYKRIDLFNTRTVVQLPAVFSPPTVRLSAMCKTPLGIPCY